MSLFSAILVLPNWHAKSYIEGEACLLLNQVMKGKNKGKKNKNQLLMLSWKSGIVLEKCFICVVLNISFPFFEQTVMLAFSNTLVFAQQDHLPLKKNMEYVKWLVPIMPGWRSPVYLIIRRSSWRMVTLLPTRPKLTSAQKDWQISIFLLWCASTMLFYVSFRWVPFL